MTLLHLYESVGLFIEVLFLALCVTGYRQIYNVSEQLQIRILNTRNRLISHFIAAPPFIIVLAIAIKQIISLFDPIVHTHPVCERSDYYQQHKSQGIDGLLRYINECQGNDTVYVFDARNELEKIEYSSVRQCISRTCKSIDCLSVPNHLSVERKDMLTSQANDKQNSPSCRQDSPAPRAAQQADAARSATPPASAPSPRSPPPKVMVDRAVAEPPAPITTTEDPNDIPKMRVRQRDEWTRKIEWAIETDQALQLRAVRASEVLLLDNGGKSTGKVLMNACEDGQNVTKSSWTIWKKTKYPSVPGDSVIFLSRTHGYVVAKRRDLAPYDEVRAGRPPVVCFSDGTVQLENPRGQE
jgi:hypothetical protein